MRLGGPGRRRREMSDSLCVLVRILSSPCASLCSIIPVGYLSMVLKRFRKTGCTRCTRMRFVEGSLVVSSADIVSRFAAFVDIIPS